MTIGERIRQRRISQGLSQEALALRIGYKSRSSLNKIEIGVQSLPQSKIKPLSDALCTAPEIIMGWVSEDAMRWHDNLTIGQRIAKKRREVGLSQKELGKALGISGAAIAQYETGNRNPKYDTVKKIAAVLNCGTGYLLDGGLHVKDRIVSWHSDKAARLEIDIDSHLLESMKLLASEDGLSLSDEVEKILNDELTARVEEWENSHPDGGC